VPGAGLTSDHPGPAARVAARPFVRVGIVSWNTSDLLASCLDAVPAALAGYDAEVVVVDNASSDDSLEVARARPFVRAIANPSNAGYAMGMNLALADHDGQAADVLIALNPDAEAPPGSLAALVAHLWGDPRVGLVVPRLAHADGAMQHSVYRFPSPAVTAAVSFVPPRLQRGPIGRRFWLEGAHPHDATTDIDWAIGAVHVIRAEAARQVAAGPAFVRSEHAPVYSERWFMYVEDLDLCWRLRQGGWRVRLDADVTVPHVGNVAGAKAWGGRRVRRWTEATTDWYAQVHGRRRARAWAALNAVGASVHLATRGVRTVTGPRRAESRVVAAQLRAIVPVHVAIARHGPPPPDTSPP